MAASKWQVYNKAKTYLMDGTIDLDAATLRMVLAKGSSNASTYTLTAFTELTNVKTTNVGTGAGANHVRTLTASVVSVNASTKKFVFASTNCVFTASGGDMTSVKYAVIYVSGGKVICWSKLTTSTTVTSTNTLTVKADGTNGVFTLSGGTTA